MTVTNSCDDFFDSSKHYTGPPLNDAMVTSAERALGYTLPAAYVGLLRVKNGGVPKRKCYPTRGTTWSDNHVQMTVLFGIGGQWGIDSEGHGSRHMIQEGGFPEIGVIIGWTPTAGHDAIVLDYTECGPQGEPQVTLVDAESGESAFLAPNLEAFLKGLVDCQPYEEQRKKELEEYRRRMQKPE